MNRVPAESPVELTGTLQHQQPANQPANQPATLVCHLAKPWDWSCHSERVGSAGHSRVSISWARGEDAEEDEWITERRRRGEGRRRGTHG